MNILMVGNDTHGAFQMRAVQLGGAIGARVTVDPKPSDWSWADLVVLVKRAAMRWHGQTLHLRVPVVWDVLDFWAQPEDNGLTRDAMIALVRKIQQACGATTLIGATRAMSAAIGGVYLPHHCRIGLEPAPLREDAAVVAYEGQKKYLGLWAKALQQSCAELGLRFAVNPPDIREADVVVSFRDGRWDGWACRQWKSGVKHVNAIVAGRPIVCQSSAAWDDLRPVGTFIDNMHALMESLRLASLYENRAEAYEYSRKAAYTYQLPAVAREYADILQQAARKAA